MTSAFFLLALVHGIKMSRRFQQSIRPGETLSWFKEMDMLFSHSILIIQGSGLCIASRISPFFLSYSYFFTASRLSSITSWKTRIELTKETVSRGMWARVSRLLYTYEKTTSSSMRPRLRVSRMDVLHGIPTPIRMPFTIWRLAPDFDRICFSSSAYPSALSCFLSVLSGVCLMLLIYRPFCVLCCTKVSRGCSALAFGVMVKESLGSQAFLR